MGIVTGFVAFAMIWWMVLFMVLPFGVRGQWEEGGGPEGSEPGAPVRAQMPKKLWRTTLIAFGIWLVFAILAWSGLLSLDSFPQILDIPED